MARSALPTRLARFPAPHIAPERLLENASLPPAPDSILFPPAPSHPDSPALSPRPSPAACSPAACRRTAAPPGSLAGSASCSPARAGGGAAHTLTAPHRPLAPAPMHSGTHTPAPDSRTGVPLPDSSRDPPALAATYAHVRSARSHPAPQTLPWPHPLPAHCNDTLPPLPQPPARDTPAPRPAPPPVAPTLMPAGATPAAALRSVRYIPLPGSAHVRSHSCSPALPPPPPLAAAHSPPPPPAPLPLPVPPPRSPATGAARLPASPAPHWPSPPVARLSTAARAAPGSSRAPRRATTRASSAPGPGPLPCVLLAPASRTHQSPAAVPATPALATS